MNKKTLGIGILSWKAHETLRSSLDSYRDNGFLDFFDQQMIYFSDISDDDRAIAEDYGWEFLGGPNEGIAGGMKHLAEHMKTDYVLLLQNDNPIVEDAHFARDHIKQAVALMEDGKADLARMRHRWKVGEGFADVRKYLKYYDVQNISPHYVPQEHDGPSVKAKPFSKPTQRLLKPKNAKRFQGRSIFIEDRPETLYPDMIQREGDFLIIDSSVLDFTDQCLLISREKWLDIFMAYVENHHGSTRSSNGFKAPELVINGPWWRNNHFKIAQGQGVFTHARKDGSFRPDHPSNRYSKAA